MSQARAPEVLISISLDNILMDLVNKDSKRPISKTAYEFAKKMILNSYLDGIRKDNFCVDLTKSGFKINDTIPLDQWSKEQCRAFGKLYAAFSDKAAAHLKQKQTEKLTTASDVQLLWLKLPKQTDSNRKKVNEIKRYMENNGYEDNTGNEHWISLQRYINTKKPNPMVKYKRCLESVSVVMITDTNKVLLLQRGGVSGRKGTFGTLTGIIEFNESPLDALVREVHEEINCIVSAKKAQYVGTAHTVNMSKDLADKDQAVTYANDDSYVYAIKITEAELVKTIKLDDENSQWRLFTRDALQKHFVTCHNSVIHGNAIDMNEEHVALSKSLLALDYAENNFQTMEVKKFNYPYTNSHGFFVKAVVKNECSKVVFSTDENISILKQLHN